MEDKSKVMSESERQEKRLRDAARARKRRKRAKSFIIWLAILAS